MASNITWDEIDTAWDNMGEMTWDGLSHSEWDEETPDTDDSGVWYRVY